MRMSLPMPPNSWSLPPRALSVSLPPKPEITSLPAPPVRVLAPLVPTSTTPGGTVTAAVAAEVSDSRVPKPSV
ncbi:hypothetical protein D9M71_395370 [compost metagenome]